MPDNKDDLELMLAWIFGAIALLFLARIVTLAAELSPWF